MNSSLEPEKLDKLRRLSRGLSINFFLGIFGVILSFFENSPAWTCFILLTGWIGVVMGLTGGPGYAMHLLGQVPAGQQLSKPVVFVLGLVTFWIPTLAAAVYGLALAGGLREDIQPQSHIDDNSMKMIFQVFVMYFLSAGTTWGIVYAETKKVIDRTPS